jgi:hypothetical protein
LRVPRRFLLQLVLALATHSAIARESLAECPGLSPVEALKDAPLAFVGDLVRVDDWGIATLRVIERLKGKVPDEVVVRDGVQGIESWPVFTQPGRYLVFIEPCLRIIDSEWPPHPFDIPVWCPETRLLRSVNAKELLQLQKYVHANRKTLSPGELK